MEEKHLQYKEYKGILDNLLAECKGNLDQFVVAKNEINIDAVSGELVESFLQKAVQKSWEDDVFAEELFAFLRNEYVESDCKVNQFLNFCEAYVQSKRKPYVIAAFLRDMEEEQFKKAVDFCLHNRILQITKKEQDYLSRKEEMFLINTCYNIIQMRVLANYAKDKTEDEIKKVIGLSKPKTDYVYDAADHYLDELWKICITREIMNGGQM